MDKVMSEKEYRYSILDKYWETPFNEIPKQYVVNLGYGMRLLNYEEYLRISFLDKLL